MDSSVKAAGVGLAPRRPGARVAGQAQAVEGDPKRATSVVGVAQETGAEEAVIALSAAPGGEEATALPASRAGRAEAPLRGVREAEAAVEVEDPPEAAAVAVAVVVVDEVVDDGNHKRGI